MQHEIKVHLLIKAGDDLCSRHFISIELSHLMIIAEMLQAFHVPADSGYFP